MHLHHMYEQTYEKLVSVVTWCDVMTQIEINGTDGMYMYHPAQTVRSRCLKSRRKTTTQEMRCTLLCCLRC